MAKKEKKTQNQEKESNSSEIVKKFKQSPGIYIGSVVVLILVTVTFIGGDFISGGGLSGRGSDFIFGYYDKEPIEYVPGNFLAERYQNIASFFQSVYQADLGNPMIAEIVWRQAYDSTVLHTAILQIMKRSNYAVSRNVVDREVSRDPDFQENGRFSRELYRRMPETRRLSKWREKQEELTKQMFLNDYNSLLISSGEADFIAGMSGPLRNFGMASFPLDSYPEEEYRSYALANSDLFKSIHLSIITISSGEKEARKILESVKNGITTFEDAARNHSQDSYAGMGGDTGNRYAADLYQLIPNASDRNNIFSLHKGEISDIVSSGNAWSFFRIENEISAADFDDETTMEKVRSYIKSSERGRIVDWAIANANEFISDVKESGFDNAVLSRNMEMEGFGPLPLNYGSVELFTSLESFSVSGAAPHVLGSLARNESFWKTAFSTPVGAPSLPHVEGEYVFVFYPFDETEADESSMEYISSVFKSLYLAGSDDYEQHRYQTFLNYFLNSDRMDNQFRASYNRYFGYLR